MKGKILISAVGVSVMMLLCGCENNTLMPSPDLSGNISLQGTISCGTIKAEAEISRTDGVWKITYTSPDSISGMEIVTSGTDCKVTHSGIVFDYKTEDVPFVTAIDYVTGAIDSTAQKDSISLSKGTDEKGKEEIRLSGTVLESGFTITTDSMGNISSVSAGGYKFTAVTDDKKKE